jgi:hypothetical protein
MPEIEAVVRIGPNIVVHAGTDSRGNENHAAAATENYAAARYPPIANR